MSSCFKNQFSNDRSRFKTFIMILKRNLLKNTMRIAEKLISLHSKREAYETLRQQP